MPKARTNKGVDLNKIKKPVGSYPATLYIGNMSFGGKLSRMNNVSNKEIKQAIKEVLKEISKPNELITELKIGEAEALVERVAQEEKFTPEDMKEVRDNILKLVGGWDTYAKIYDLMRNEGESLEEIAIGAAGDAAQEKLLELMFKEAGGNISKVVDGIFICADQYAEDKEKWKNRADALNAKRMLNDFYEKVNERIENKANSCQMGWSLAIEDTNRAYFSFYGIEGNCQTWNVRMLLKKKDEGKGGPSGNYEGPIDIEVEYDMGPFDRGYLENLLSDMRENPQYCIAEKELSMKYTYEYSPTKITRRLQTCSTSINIVSSNTNIISEPIDFANFDDDKKIKLAHKLITTYENDSDDGCHYYFKKISYYKSNNEEKITVKDRIIEDYIICDGKKSLLEDPSNTDDYILWDTTIWEQWDKEKRLEISFPK